MGSELEPYDDDDARTIAFEIKLSFVPLIGGCDDFSLVFELLVYYDIIIVRIMYRRVMITTSVAIIMQSFYPIDSFNAFYTCTSDKRYCVLIYSYKSLCRRQ